MDITFTTPERGVATLALVYDRPALKGSEKQIAWAETIRAQAEASIIEAIAKQSKAPVVRYDTQIPCFAATAPEAQEGVLAAIRAILGMTQKDISMGQIIAAALAEDSAAAWIDNRYADARKLMTAAAQKLQGR